MAGSAANTTIAPELRLGGGQGPRWQGPSWQGSSWKEPGIVPGFGLSLGLTVLALSLIVLIPLAALVLKAAGAGPMVIWEMITSPRVLAALRVSFGISLLAALVNLVFGVLIAWVLVRYEFPGRRFVDAAVDLPFALPTAVAGIALAALYAPNGWLGKLLSPLGITVGYTPLGILVALIFIGLPFVVRTVQPVLAEMERDLEEAAALLGASRWRTATRIILPPILPAAMTGFTLAFARAVGEYGSVIFIAGNVPLVSEIAPLLIVIRLEQFDYAGAAVIGLIMLLMSFVMILGLNLAQSALRARLGHV
jgi:sulfate/thiosulfate transport system permease protein